MVNLVVRHGTHLQPAASIPRSKSPAISNKFTSPKAPTPTSTTTTGRDRVVPSPIRVPAYQNSRRPVSPLTTSESMFGTVIPEVEQSRSQSSDNSSRRGGGPANRLDPIISRDSLTDANGDLVCDYDQNVTPLYELLESSQWDKARLRCRTHPEEVQTWIVRRDATGNIRWKLLPLHAAVIFQAPYPVIEGMLKEYPIAAGKRDDQGMLALHLAFRHKQDEALLEILLSQYPQAVAVKDRRDRLPLDHGRETQYSTALVQKYAEAFAKSQAPRAAQSSAAEEVSKTAKKYEVQMEALKVKYEDRMATMMRQHEQELRDLKLKMDQDQHVVRTQHDQEMDELRDLLSREVAAGQRTRQNQQELEEMQNSLAQAHADNQALRGRLHDQQGCQDELKEHIQKILEDQKTLHDFCVQQQQELEQANQVREQLLRSLIQKDDGNAVQSSREICQLSENIRLRTEQVLNRASAIQPPEPKTNPAGIPPPVRTEHLVLPDEYEEHQHHNDNGGWGVGQEGDDHGDDISAITDDHF